MGQLPVVALTPCITFMVTLQKGKAPGNWPGALYYPRQELEVICQHNTSADAERF
jgi:hypothetical protein